jgi:hypothetical protein
MTGWADVVLTLGVGVIGVGGAIAAALVQSRLARQNREAAEREARIERGASALAPIATLLTNLVPERLAVNASEDLLQDLQNYRVRWETALRDPMATFALAHPSPGVRDLATRLDVHVEWVLVRGVSLVRDVLQGRDWSEMEALVRSHYEDAQRIIQELHSALHGPAAP